MIKQYTNILETRVYLKQNKYNYTHITIKIYYDKGDKNYYPERFPRGYYLSTNVCCGNTYCPSDGGLYLLEKVQRKSKKLDNYYTNDYDIQPYINKLLAKYNLLIKE